MTLSIIFILVSLIIRNLKTNRCICAFPIKGPCLAASHQDKAEMNDEGIIHVLGETNSSNSCIIQDNNTDTQYELNNQETNLKECVSRKSPYIIILFYCFIFSLQSM
jgi:predicted component of type VI protein secretion system